MSLRWSRPWSLRPLGQALASLLLDESLAVPRVGGLFPGISTPIPAPRPVSLVDACHNAAKALLAKHNVLYVLWSGGTDSTLVACLLLAHRTHQRIILTTGAQAENDAPEGLAQRLLLLGAELEPASVERMRQVVAEGGMVVTGTHADSILIGELVDQRGLWDRIHDLSPAELVQANLGCSSAEARRLLNIIEPLLLHMPVERTAANIAWWLDFSCLWDRDRMDLHLRLGLLPPDEGYVHFFGSEDFQCWSQRDAREKVGDSWATHKAQYLALIDDVLGYRPSFIKNDFGLELPCLETGRGGDVLGIDANYRVMRAALR